MDREQKQKVPPAVFSADPEEQLEDELSRDPHDLGKKADVGSDESMDASDPPSVVQSGSGDEPVPSSSFPE